MLQTKCERDDGDARGRVDQGGRARAQAPGARKEREKSVQSAGQLGNLP